MFPDLEITILSKYPYYHQVFHVNETGLFCNNDQLTLHYPAFNTRLLTSKGGILNCITSYKTWPCNKVKTVTILY